MTSKNKLPGKNGSVKGPAIPNNSGKKQPKGLCVTQRK